MSKILFIFILIIFSKNLIAQDDKTKIFNFNEKNNYATGIHIKGLLTGDNFFEYYGLSGGKFFKKNILAGLELERGFYGYWERSTNFGVFGRYYFKINKRFSYFSQGEYLFGFVNYYNTETASEWSGLTQNAGLNAGISYSGFYKKHFSINFITGYDFNFIAVKNHPTLGKYHFSKHDLSYCFEINYFFK